MIIDHLANAALYYGLGAGIEAGLRFLSSADLARLPPGRNEIRGDALFAVVSEYQTKIQASVQWEAHRRYIDIQYIIRGAEAIGYQCVSRMDVVRPYDKAADALILRGHGNRLVVADGYFVIFYPQDAHQPGMNVRGSGMVRKVVVKALVN